MDEPTSFICASFCPGVGSEHRHRAVTEVNTQRCGRPLGASVGQRLHTTSARRRATVDGCLVGDAAQESASGAGTTMVVVMLWLCRTFALGAPADPLRAS